MKLSILDQAPISSHQSAKEALEASVKLAKAGEDLGYTRFWIAEHHDLRGLACPAPEVMLSYIGSQTNYIRIGSGAVLLPHYKPYKIAEMYNMLAVLFPGRIDVGIGRAPGGSAEATNALSENFLQQVWKFPDLIEDLLHFLDDDYQTENAHVTLSASPVPEVAPIPWLLGTSKKSALLAAQKGMSYAFGQFMSDSDGVEIIKQYVEHFKPRKEGVKTPPSLQNIYKELQDDVGCYIPNHGHLVEWTKQGVLLLNAVLTVRAGVPNSHKALGWENFTDKVIKTLNERETPVVFILWGRFAQQKQQLITSPHHHIIKSPHPSPFSANRGFFGSKPFSKTNEFLRSIGSAEIDWQITNL